MLVGLPVLLLGAEEEKKNVVPVLLLCSEEENNFVSDKENASLSIRSERMYLSVRLPSYFVLRRRTSLTFRMGKTRSC